MSDDRPHSNGSRSERQHMLERTLLALLAQHIIEETVNPGVAIKSFDGPATESPPPGYCQICLDFVLDGENHYILTTMDRKEHPFHSDCLETYMESQVQSHGRGRTNNLTRERPGPRPE